MRSLTPRLALALLATLLATLPAFDAARAQARIEDCETIQAADAYNQCLAKFGPSGKNLNMEPEKPSDVKSDSADAAATALKRPRLAPQTGRHRFHRGSGGRMRATFTIHRRRH